MNRECEVCPRPGSKGAVLRKGEGSMNVKYLKAVCALVTLLCAATAASADIKVKTKTTMQGHSSEGTTYIKKSRERSEQNMGAMQMTSITQCDLRRSIQLNDKARTYLITSFEAGAPADADSASSRGLIGKQQGAANQGATRRGGVITVTHNVIDTGERKQMFGMTARHLKVTMTMESSPEACNPSRMKMEMDGWYVDLEYGLNCQWNSQPVAAGGAAKPDCVDEFRYKTTGNGKLGYPLLQTTVMFGADGREMSRVTTEVVELTTATLDPALFEIPAGYTEAKTAQEFYAAAAMSSMKGAQPRKDDGDGDTSSATKAAPAAVAAGLTAAGTPKKAGAIRIGVMMPKTQTTERMPGAQAAEAVRNTFVSFINGPAVEVVALNARLLDQAIEEAKQGQCDYVLISSFSQKKGGGGMFGKALGNVAGSAAGHLPYGNSAGDAAARAAVSTAIYTTAEISGSIKSKDEVGLEYTLQTVEDARILLTNSDKAKAKQDGEDIITPLIEKAARAIVGAVKR